MNRINQVIMKDQIVSISLSRSTTCSLISFHNGILDLIEKTTPAALHIESQFPVYKTAVGTLASIVRRRTAFVSTQMLQEADQRCDNGCRTKNMQGRPSIPLMPPTHQSEYYLYICGKIASYPGPVLHNKKQTTNEEDSISAWIFRYRQLSDGYCLERVP